MLRFLRYHLSHQKWTVTQQAWAFSKAGVSRHFLKSGNCRRITHSHKPPRPFTDRVVTALHVFNLGLVARFFYDPAVDR